MFAACMGDKFTVNERNLNIKVTVNATTGEYTATWGQFHTKTAYSAATALRMLADEFEDKSMHGSAQETLRNYRKHPDIFCKFCSAPIFFAVLSSGKYLAFDTDPIAGEDLADEERGAIFPRTIHTNRGPKPLAAFKWGAVATGPVYIPHPQTCGDSVTAPTSPILLARWKQNRTVSTERVSQVVAGLRAIRADIKQGALDDPREHEPDIR